MRRPASAPLLLVDAAVGIVSNAALAAVRHGRRNPRACTRTGECARGVFDPMAFRKLVE